MISTHAAALTDALRSNTLIEPLDDAVLPDQAAAYAIQSDFLAALNEPISGWKIGATNAGSQKMMGLPGPFFGPMPRRFCVNHGTAVPMPAGIIGAEIELAFRLATDLPRRSEAYTLEEIQAAISGAYLAIEVIGLRQEGEGVPNGRRAIADLGANCVFAHSNSAIEGLTRKLSADPASVTARCLIDGIEKGAGDAAIVLGNPLAALQWLASHGPGLTSGQWISTGTITGMAPISAPCHVVGDFGDLGQVRLDIVA